MFTMIQTWPYDRLKDANRALAEGAPGDHSSPRKARREVGGVRVIKGRPLTISGLVECGQIRTAIDWSGADTSNVFVDAAGRAIAGTLRAFRAAEARKALPITCYRVARKD